MSGFWNNFQDHRRLSGQLLVSQAAVGKLEQASWRDLLEGFLQLVSDFIEASRNCIVDVLLKKTAKNCANHQRSFKKYCFDFQNLSKNCSSRDTILLTLFYQRFGLEATREIYNHMQKTLFTIWASQNNFLLNFYYNYKSHARILNIFTSVIVRMYGYGLIDSICGKKKKERERCTVCLCLPGKILSTCIQ
jgi:hypothetical protein